MLRLSSSIYTPGDLHGEVSETHSQTRALEHNSKQVLGKGPTATQRRERCSCRQVADQLVYNGNSPDATHEVTATRTDISRLPSASSVSGG
jgi:hypothetical protein